MLFNSHFFKLEGNDIVMATPEEQTENLPLAKRAANSLKNWLEALESGQKIALLLATSLTPVIALVAANIPPQAEELSEVERFLEIEFSTQRGPVPNAVAMWSYSKDYRHRIFLAAYSPWLNEAFFRDEMGRMSTQLDGWSQQLQSHFKGKTHVIRKTDYKPGHPMYNALRQAGAQVIVTAPIIQDSKLKGYISTGYNSVPTDDDLAIIKTQLRDSAISGRAFFNSPN
jgi:hypothetical protein